MATQSPVLFVSNHSSYLDIPVLGALIPASFVAKAEVADWPLFGILAKLQNTVFIARRQVDAVAHCDALSARLARHRNIILFPEGTSTDGQRVVHFKSSLFNVANEAGGDGPNITVQPVSVTCIGFCNFPATRIERSRYAWYGDMAMPKHLWKIFQQGSFTIEVMFHPPVMPADFPDRKALATYCQKRVALGVEAGISGNDINALAHK
jgi:1-acyl-sn-glycerol-3-phosphate acyltransferase